MNSSLKWRWHRSVLTLLVISTFFISVTAVAQAPSSVLPDLQYFKLTFPLDDNGNDYAGVSYSDRDNPLISAWEKTNLSGWTPSSPYSNYFFVSGGEVVFRAHCAGALTSANAYPRCELRETPNGTDDLWEFADEHELNATFRVTHLPDVKQEVCMLQIKGNSSNNTSGTEEAFRLEYRQDGSSGVHVVINENTTLSDIMDYSLGQTIVARMYVNNGDITINLNNTDVSGTNGEWNYNYSSNYSHGYFKAGCYTQSSIWSEKNKVGDESNNAYGEVRFSDLTMGPSSGGGGGTTCSASVPGGRSVSGVGTGSATVSWSAVASIDHYKVRHREVGSSSWITSPSISSTATSYTISGLNNSTTYEWQVRSKCPDNSGSNYSSGQGPNFTTSGGSSGGGGSSSLPSPWATTDIGNVAATGSATYSSGTFTVQGSGNDIWNSTDEFRFVYQSLNGDGTITAQVNSLSNTNSWAKSGVMIRESLSGGSKHACTVITPTKGVAFQRRASTNGGSSNTHKSGHSAPEWVRIERTGNTFKSYHSSNGSSWTQIGSQTISMSSNVYVGLCLTSHNDGTLATASISNVSLSTGTSSSVPTGNLALNKPASQSSTYSTAEAERAVDGNTNGKWSGGSVTHTQGNSAGSSWEVDLQATYPIEDINIYNRTDGCCVFRLGNFTVKVLNSSGSTVWQQTITTAPNPSTTVNAGGVSGQFVEIVQNLNEPLSLAEVQVYAVSTKSSNVSTPTEIEEAPVYLFPNPANDVINVTGLQPDEPVRIYGMSGELVLESQGSSQIDISTLSPGLYFLTSTATTKPIRFMKQ